MECAAAGDIPGCMEMQRKANDCLRRHGINTPDLPESYYMLMHESISAAREGDMVGARLIGAKMNEIIESLGFDADQAEAEFVVPEECQRIDDEIQRAEAAGDFPRGIRLLQQFDRCLQRHGLPSPGLPEEWFDIQILMHEAHSRGDILEFERLQELSQEMLDKAGLTDAGLAPGIEPPGTGGQA